MKRVQRNIHNRPFLRLAAAAALLATPLLTAAPLRAEDPVCGDAPDQVRLELTVAGLQSTDGQVTITVFPDDPKRFLAKRGKLLRVRLPAEAPDTTACIVLPAPGGYAVTVYHDANANRKFDLTTLGMPDEGYGVSNDAPTIMALPSFKDARFEVGAGDNAMTIHLTY